MPAKISLIGLRFGRLKVIKSGPTIICGVAKVKTKTSVCRCDCGRIKTIRSYDLTSRKTKSCGCFRAEATSKKFKTHGWSHTRAYNQWNSMMQRCTNPNVDNYHNYGGRGIRVCNRWMTFSNFLADMGECPPGLTIERINNKTGNYEKSNCKWDTRRNQSRNTRRNIIYTVHGKTACLKELCEMFGKNYTTTYWRLNHGRSVERAFA